MNIANAPSVIRKGNIIHGRTKNYEPLDGGLGRFIFKACEKYGDQIMQVCGETGQSETFSSVKSRSLKVAAEMKRRGVCRKDIIVICTPNTLDSCIVPMAALYLGAAIASLDATLSPRDTEHLLSLVEPKIVFVHENSVDLVENALKANGREDVEIVVYGKSDKYSTFNDFLLDEDGFEPEYIDEDEMSFIMFSSGTTGLPKGIILTHKSVYLSTSTFSEHIIQGTCSIIFTTLYWISGVILLISQFCNGTKKVIVNAFNPETAFELIEKYKVLVSFMATPYVHKICKLDNLHKYDVSSLKYIVFAGGPVAPDQLKKLREILPQTYCVVAYGMTEVSGLATNFTFEDKKLAEKNPSSCGRPLTGVTLKIVDPETEETLAANKPGEIRIKTEKLMAGYYKKDSSDVYDSDGFLKTGDIGHYDDDLCLYVYDRIKEMFKYQSWHIVPASIETIITEHPDVVEAVVFGVPSEEDGHLPAAAITVSNTSVRERDIFDFVAERVHDRQTLRGGVYILNEMPKTPTEKVNRKQIQTMILQKIQKK